MSISKILKPTGSKFYRIVNASGKEWLMPSKNMTVAMNLYQPSGAKGKLLKTLFPYLHGIKFVRKALKVETMDCSLTDELQALISSLFDCDEFEFAVFGGTPCAHQKITIQIFKGDNILGYCKVSDSDEVTKLFERESKILEELRQAEVCGIPQCLFLGKIGEVNVFAQTTEKTTKSSVVHNWSKSQNDFLDSLCEKTRRELPFEDTDFNATLSSLENHIDWLSSFVDKNSIINLISKIRDEHKNRNVVYSAYHADFTPWNMFANGDNLFVFDWEYAQRTYPPNLDKCHFFTQTAIFEKHWNSEKIIEYIESNVEKLYFDKKIYFLYLLDMITRFTVREKGNITEDVLDSFKIWYNLLKHFQQ